ncbi:hypothetical protein HDU78_002394 [Chytriomyces hyalinus]|nr:hypothetical protein HDU78_002394 [Chytriomyces hyalinus]
MATNNYTANESFFGFVETQLDAQILVEAVIHKLIEPVFNMPLVMSGLSIRSGSVIVFPERKDQAQLSRWRDAFCWSASRMNGPFLLYREIEPSEKAVRKQMVGGLRSLSASPLSSAPPPALSRSGRQARSTLFATSSLRKNTKLVPDGFAKRTIVITGSDGGKYRVISYFYPSDVEHIYQPRGSLPPHQEQMALKTPSQTQFFQHTLLKHSKLVPPPHAPAPAPLRTPVSPSVSIVQLPSAAPTRESSADDGGDHGRSSSLCACGCVRLSLNQVMRSLMMAPRWLEQPAYLAPLQRV